MLCTCTREIEFKESLLTMTGQNAHVDSGQLLVEWDSQE